MIQILNWNVGGAKFLELESREPRPYKVGMDFECREEYRISLNRVLRRLIQDEGEPLVVCLQEIVQYEESGDPNTRNEILDDIENYNYFPFPLIDSEQFGATAKWSKVMEKGGWDGAYFSQGNGFLVRKDCQHFPMLCLAKTGDLKDQHPQSKGMRSGVERVDLHPGLYFGHRDSEPRAAFVLHVVQSLENGKPLDIFVVNLHLTTLQGEREGIPEIDEKASEIRINQLKVILDNCVSQYNRWRNNEYAMGESMADNEWDTTDRYNPVWVLAGDFNFTRESAEYQYLTRRNFVDIVTPGPTKASGIGQDPTIAVDHVFAGPRHYSVKSEISKSDIMGNQVRVTKALRVSDHYPIYIADIQFILNG